MKQPTVTIRHGDIEAVVSPKAAKAYERHGWTVVDDGSSKSEAPAPVPPPPDEAEEEPKPEKTTHRKAE